MMNQDSVEMDFKQTDLPVDNRSLNFSTSSEEFDLAFIKKPKTFRDPMSHRIIEKRRRDRMNNCLADLSRLIPTNYLKQGQGRIEKTEIIEMAIKHIKNLTNTVNKHGTLNSSLPDRYLGFKECQDEVMRYLVEVEGWDAMDQLCNRLMGHLEQAGEKFRIMNDESLSKDAKEEQYRHADEDHDNPMKPLVLEPGGPPQDFNPKMPPIMPQFPMTQVPHTQSMMPTSTIPRPENLFQGYESFANAQQITQDHLNRDKHLWTLLTTRFNSNTVEDSGISTGPGSNCSNNVEASPPMYPTVEDNGFKMLTDQMSGFSQGSGSQTSSDKNDNSVYKFKHNITKRFSAEEQKINPSDTSINCSRSGKRQDKIKRKFRHVRSCSPSSSGSSRYPNSDSSNNSGSSNSENISSRDEEKTSNILPAFMLHPSGTHYIPLSIHPSNLSNDLKKMSQPQGLNVYHPISIPVNFGGPLLYMRKLSIHSNKSESTGPSETSSGGSPSGCASEESGGCPSESSPSPDQAEIKVQMSQ